jgi:hypothetical protein
MIDPVEVPAGLGKPIKKERKIPKSDPKNRGLSSLLTRVPFYRAMIDLVNRYSTSCQGEALAPFG